MNDSDSRQLYNRLYRQVTMREIYRVHHIFDDHSVGKNWSELLKETRKVEGIMYLYLGPDGEVHAQFN